MEKLPQEHALNEKGLAWQREFQRLEQVGDKLGYRVDPGIKEAVVAFVLNGFPTYGSCEGHLEERWDKMIKLHPYIAVGIDEPPERYVDEAEIKQRIADQFHITPDEIEEHDVAMRAYWDYIQDKDVEETEEFKTVRMKNKMLRKNFVALLDEFYKERQQPSERPITIHGIGPAGHFHVEDASENIKEEISEDQLDTARKELAEEQTEMAALTEFLRERYFSREEK
jgi:hypothetical protein